MMSTLGAGPLLARLGEACARVRAAAGKARADDVLDAIAEQARLLAGAKHAWAASVDGDVPLSLRSTSDDSAPTSAPTPTPRTPQAAHAATLAAPVRPSMGSLLAAARPITRSDGFVACALLGSSGAPEGIVAVQIDGSRPRDLDDATFDTALTQLATIAGFALEATRLRQRIETVTKARESLLASVSHDLRNPLNTFAMSAGLLRDDLERNDVDATRGIALVSRMDRATSRMQSLIEELVEASRVDARKIELAIRAESAAQLVRDAVAAAAARASEKGASEKSASVILDVVDEDARVMADRARTLQLIAKVVAFETKSTGDGGSIRLGVSRHGDAVVFTARAFGPGGTTVTPPEEGRGGLALLLARGLVEAQRGTFGIEPTEGLTVSFTLPTAQVR